jgi:Ca2+-binding RTX toxin-like protein
MTRRPRLTLESLESKTLLSGYSFEVVGPIPYGISLTGAGTLRIRGDQRIDEGKVWVENGQVHATLMHTDYVELGGTGFVMPVKIAEPEKIVPATSVKKIVFYGEAGSDKFTNDTSIKSWAYGGAGIDRLLGGSGEDYLAGDADEDFLDGRGGWDSLVGGAGNDIYQFSMTQTTFLGRDTITEASNADTDTLDFSGIFGAVNVKLGQTTVQTPRYGVLSLKLSSALGIENAIGSSAWADKITGNSRNNVIYGGGGSDTLIGGVGSDALYGQGGDDSLVGGSHNDGLNGGDGDDRLLPGYGNNGVSDGAGNDYTDFRNNGVGVIDYTDGGDDTVIGSNYADKIVGSTGNDSLVGGKGNDSLSGAAGHDTLVAGWGQNDISDGPGNDRIDFSSCNMGVTYTTNSGHNTVIGSSYNDVLVGSSGNDKLYGRGGNDKLHGKGGSDQLYGEGGSDWLEAGSAAEVANGGSGEDYNPHKFVVNGTTAADIAQQFLGTCSILSGLAGAVRAGIDLAGRITYLGGYNFQVQLFNPDTEAVDYRIITFDGTLNKNGDGQREDPLPNDADEFWTILYQRAYLVMMNDIDEDYEDPEYALYAITGREAGTWFPWDPVAIQEALAEGKVVIAHHADQTSLIQDDHAYTVWDVFFADGQWWITLFNPWGFDGGVGQGDPNDGFITMRFWEDFHGEHDFDEITVA